MFNCSIPPLGQKWKENLCVSEKDIEIDGVLTDLELATKKAKVIIEDFDTGLF